jgi:hypothetical protein
MTSAEYRTLREACGLSVREAATFHGVGERTVMHWESERNGIPDGAGEELLALNATIQRGVDNILTLAGELTQTHGEPDTIALTRYRTAADYAGSRADLEGLPWPCHNALVGRAMTALERIGAHVTVAWA